MSSGVLHLIPTTLGEDAPVSAVLTPELLALTAGLDYFIAENARSARAFLKKVGEVCPLHKPIRDIEIRELHVDTPATALPGLLAPLLAGRDAGLVSEAGCPAIADPGANLVRLAHEHGVMVRPHTGPSSLLLAVMASGLNGQSFAFNGYLPTDPVARARRISDLEQRSRAERQTQLFIETPYRNEALFEALLKSCAPDTRLCLAIDMSLPGEQVSTRAIGQWRKLAASALPVLRKRPAVFLILG